MSAEPQSKVPRESDLRQAIHLARRAALHPRHLVTVLALSLAAAVLDALGIALLLPLLRGVIEGDLSFLQNLSVYQALAAVLPGDFWFSRGGMLAVLTVGAFSAAIAHQIFEYSAATYTCLLTRRATHRLRLALFQSSLRRGRAFFEESGFARLQTLFIDCTKEIGEICIYFREVLTRLLLCVLFLGLMAFISLRLTLVLALLGPIYLAVTRVLVGRITAESDRYTQSLEGLNRRVHRVLSCLPLVKAHGREVEEVEALAKASGEVAEVESRIDRKLQLIVPLQRIILNLQLFVLVFVVYWLMEDGAIDIAALLVYFFVLREVINALNASSFFRANLAKASGHIRSLGKLFSEGDANRLPDGTVSFCGLSSGIEIRHLDFAYSEGRAALRDLSARIPASQTTALVGPSGAGKSTLAHLLLRAYPHAPRAILLDGVPIEDFTLASLLGRIAFVSQKTHLFDGTLRENLLYGAPEATPETIAEALSHARLDRLVADLPKGLDTRLGDDGLRLSGGERQRLALARALLRQTDFWILDEATSAVDPETEFAIDHALREVLRGKTALIIAHRSRTIEAADQILLLEAGTVAESGTYAELIERRGRFFHFWNQKGV